MACAAAVRRRLSWNSPRRQLKTIKLPPACHRQVLYFVAVLLLKRSTSAWAMVIDELDLAGAQRRQAHRVLALGFADDLVQVGQAMALGIGLPVVLKAHQPGLVPARPGDELEGTRANGMFGGRVEGVRRHQDNRVVHDARLAATHPALWH